MTAYPVLVDAERRLADVIATLTPADLGRPTPCAGWDVRALLSHTLAGIEIFAATVDGNPAPSADDMFGGGDRIGDDPVGATKRATTRSQSAWADLDDPDRELDTILGRLPAREMLAVSAFATVVHTWDIEIAVGRPVVELPADLYRHTDAVARRYVPALRADGDHSLFQAETAVAAGATPTRRLMAFLGRAAAARDAS
jgi:uncharacterized protein (TIGR03086 family)